MGRCRSGVCAVVDGQVKGGGWGQVPQRVPTCHQVPNEQGLIFLVVLQHALEVFLFPLDSDLPVELVAPLLTLS